MANAICSVEDCNRPVHGLGLCGPHYWRLRTSGEISPEKPIAEKRLGRAGIWKRLDKDGPIIVRRPDLGPCWLWLGAIDVATGYGVFEVGHGADRKLYRVHTVAYEFEVGSVPDGLQLDHLCHTYDPTCPGGRACPHRRCANPTHLEPVSRKENILRGRSFSAINAAKTHCIHGHEFTPENTYLEQDGHRACRTCKSQRGKRRRST